MKVGNFVNLCTSPRYMPNSPSFYMRGNIRTAVRSIARHQTNEWLETELENFDPEPSLAEYRVKAKASGISDATIKRYVCRFRYALKHFTEKRLITYPFVLRQRVVARFDLPQDLTKDDVKRIMAFMGSLIVN